MLSVHTSPLAQPGTGDAGGMNVYVAETARELARRGIEVDVFTRATTGAVPPVVSLVPGVTVRHVVAGPYEGLAKDDLPGQLCAFAAGVMGAGAARPEGWYDLVHSHYWLSGQVGWLAADRWRVPLVHTMHTMARVKNQHTAPGDSGEPAGREVGEQQVVDAADRLVANTADEARELIELYGADPARIAVVAPGVDLSTFHPYRSGGGVLAASAGSRAEERARLGLRGDAIVIAFAGRVQPLKAPDVLVKAVAALLARRPHWRDRLVLAVLGGPSGSGLAHPDSIAGLAGDLGLADVVRILPPVPRDELAAWMRCADLVAVPSRSESFGLVALEALAVGTPVVAAAVGGLPTAVGDAGVLVHGHDPIDWARALEGLLADTVRRELLSCNAIRHARRFAWDVTAARLIDVYRDAIGARSIGAVEPSVDSAATGATPVPGVPESVIP